MMDLRTKLAATLAPLAILALGLLAMGQGGCGERAPVASSGAGGASGGGSAGSPTAAVTSGGGGELWPCADGSGSVPAEVPEGWVRAPCMPSSCNIFFSTSPQNARPPSPWADCGPGCLELVHDWGDPRYRIYASTQWSATNGRKRIIGYTRQLGDTYGPPGPDQLWDREYQIIQLPENIVLFDALVPYPYPTTAGKCFFFEMYNISTNSLLGQSRHSKLEDGSDAKNYWLKIALESANPSIFHFSVGHDTPIESVLTPDRWAVSYGRTSIQWSDLTPTKTLDTLWTSDGVGLANALMGLGETLFFSTQSVTGVPFDTFAWDPSGGLRTLIATSDPSQSGSCCVKSDGNDMVWFEGSGFNPTDNTYAVVDLMTSPHATSAAELQPRRLRTTFSNRVQRHLRVGGGYAVSSEWEKGDGDNKRYVVTRLSDGAYWTIPPRPGFLWTSPLYIDAEELALPEVATAAVIQEQGLQLGVYTIVRLAIAELGPPTPAE